MSLQRCSCFSRLKHWLYQKDPYSSRNSSLKSVYNLSDVDQRHIDISGSIVEGLDFCLFCSFGKLAKILDIFLHVLEIKTLWMRFRCTLETLLIPGSFARALILLLFKLFFIGNFGIDVKFLFGPIDVPVHSRF